MAKQQYIPTRCKHCGEPIKKVTEGTLKDEYIHITKDGFMWHCNLKAEPEGKQQC